MAEALSFFADEISRAIAVVWGGVAIASELNYRLMTIIITSTSRIVQLLFLLTQKVADVFSIIGGDVLLFIGDIGMGTIAFFNLFRNLSSSVLSFVVAMISGVCNSVYYLFQLVCSLFNGVLNIAVLLQDAISSGLILIRESVILLGSSILFIVTFMPKVVYFLICEAVYAIQRLQTSFEATVRHLFSFSEQLCKQAADSVVNYFAQISFEAITGLILGGIFIVIMKISWNYLPSDIMSLPGLYARSATRNLKKIILSWYLRMCNFSATNPPPEYNPGEEFDDGNDENGNDNNQNIPDRNLERELISQPPVRQSNGMQLIRRPLTRSQRRTGLMRDTSEEEIPTIPKSLSKEPLGDEQSSSSDNIADQLQEQLEEERDNQLCVICQDRRKDVILLPCRHLCLCKYCSESIMRCSTTCPICRKQVADILKVYL